MKRMLSPPPVFLDGTFPEGDAELTKVAAELGYIESYMQKTKNKVAVGKTGSVMLTSHKYMLLNKEGFEKLVKDFNPKKHAKSQVNLVREVHNLFAQWTLQQNNIFKPKLLWDRIADTAIDSFDKEEKEALLATLNQLTTADGWQKLHSEIYNIEDGEFILRDDNLRIVFTQTKEGNIRILDIINYKSVMRFFPNSQGDR